MREKLVVAAVSGAVMVLFPLFFPVNYMAGTDPWSILGGLHFIYREVHLILFNPVVDNPIFLLIYCYIKNTVLFFIARFFLNIMYNVQFTCLPHIYVPEIMYRYVMYLLPSKAKEVFLIHLEYILFINQSLYWQVATYTRRAREFFLHLVSECFNSTDRWKFYVHMCQVCTQSP